MKFTTLLFCLLFSLQSFSQETQTIDITHSNKLIKDSGLQHFELVKPKKFWQTTVFKIGIGVIGGILIAK